VKYVLAGLLALALLAGVGWWVYGENVRRLFEPSTDVFPPLPDGGSPNF
jgi:hypothetical protein